jgi:hypothetical protein
MPSVVGLFVSPAIGQPMQPRTSVQALAGRGLEGDRYALGQGSFSNLPRRGARHVSLIAREAMEASNEELVRRGLIPFEPKETRRNIVVEGIDVCALLGHEFRIGAVRLRGSEPTLPCRIPSAVRWQDWICGGISQSGRHTRRGLVGWNYFGWRSYSDGLVAERMTALGSLAETFETARAMSALGQKRKSSKRAQRVCFSPESRSKSGHRFMSALGHERTSFATLQPPSHHAFIACDWK